MINWLLIVCIIIVVALGIVGGIQGFVKMIFHVLSTIIVIVVTILFSSKVTGLLQNNEKIYEAVYGKVVEIVKLESEDPEVDTAEELIDSLKFPTIIKNMIKGSDAISEYRDSSAEELAEYIHTSIAGVIFKAAGFIITFIAAAIIMGIATFIFDHMSQLPVLKDINVIAGIALGALEGVLVIWVFFVFVTMFASSKFGQIMMSMISENPILDFIYTHNIISKYLF